MTTLTLQKAFEACQANKSAWLQRRDELKQAEQAYREQLAGNGHSGRSLQTLREIIDVKKWEINQAAGRYIRSHEEVQRISIRDRLNDFMQAHGAELAAALAPELMNYSGNIPPFSAALCSTHSIICARRYSSGWSPVKKSIIRSRIMKF